MTLKSCLALGAAFALTAVLAPAANADEGMWTFDNFPTQKVKDTYGVTLDRAFLDKIQSAAVRLSGCSASVVSPDGLVLTNAHCVIACAQDLSSPAHDYVNDGFFTAARTEEKACPGQTAEILLTITDVTKAVNAASAGLTGADFVKAQGAKTAELEKAACGDDKALRCQVIGFYQGGQYKLYKYRRYSDVRLVFYPEYKAAFFGGDPDNFNFPRFNLDSGFLRLYENGQPVKTPGYLKFATQAPKENDLVLVAGNPGSTSRLLTVSQLETLRDVTIPTQQLMRSELRGRLIQFGEESPENKKITVDTLTSLENGYKVYFGQQLALQDPKVMEAKRAEEAALKAGMSTQDKALYGDPWADLAEVQSAAKDLYLPYYFLDQSLNSSSLFSYARTLVRAAKARTMPSAERLPEYADTRLPLLEKRLLDPANIHAGHERIFLEFRLLKAREYLTADNAVTKLLLGKESPEGLSRRLIEGTRLGDPVVRKALWEGGLEAIKASDDPMIQYALKIDEAALAVRRDYEAKVSGPTRIAAEKIAKIRFSAYGDTTYPDATFSLRLSYGKVTGWTYRGQTVTPFTTFAGLYDRATGNDPFELSAKFALAQGRLNLNTVYNFSSTNDIIGGNSGSPVINAKGEVVGAAFDGNIHSLGGAYYYDGTINRTVTVATPAILEALEKVYGRTALVRELTAGK